MKSLLLLGWGKPFISHICECTLYCVKSVEILYVTSFAIAEGMFTLCSYSSRLEAYICVVYGKVCSREHAPMGLNYVLKI